MAMKKCALNIDQNKQELQPHGTEEFPCEGFCEQLSQSPSDVIPWHWHNEFEIIYVPFGSLQVGISEKKVIVNKGELLFINANVLHYAQAEAECTLHSLVFSSALVSGNPDSVFAKKYIQPLIGLTALDAFLFVAQNDNERKIIDNFITAFTSIDSECSGYEFLVRENLSLICLALYHAHAHDLMPPSAKSGIDNIRIKKMLDYIHERYADHLTLSAISQAAHIGERECLRCFQRIIHLSPLRYVLQYRITKGAHMLLHDSDKTVASIAGLCGFDSPGNFSQLFKRIYDCTPKDYRKINSREYTKKQPKYKF